MCGERSVCGKEKSCVWGLEKGGDGVLWYEIGKKSDGCVCVCVRGEKVCGYWGKKNWCFVVCGRDKDVFV